MIAQLRALLFDLVIGILAVIGMCAFALLYTVGTCLGPWWLRMFCAVGP